MINSSDVDEELATSLEEDFRTLIALLDTEREALINHDADALQSCVGKKNELCQQIAASLASPTGMTLARAIAGQSPEKPDTDHKSLATLVNLASSARDSNLVNGKILHRSQQSIREILTILSGKTLDGLYGHTGQQNSATPTGVNAIAQA